MNNMHSVLVPCRHGDAASGKGCIACEGSGFVKVIVAQDGQPKPCEHASTDGKLETCLACLGSGWAGIDG